MDPSRRFFIRSSMAAVALLSWSRFGFADGAASGPSGSSASLEPSDPASLEELAARFPGFTCARRREWVLLSGGSRESSARTLDLLEGTAEQVVRSMRAIGLPATAPSTRHLALSFPTLEAYRAFALAEDHYDDAHAVGHYESRARRSTLAAAIASSELRRAIVRGLKDPRASARAEAEIDRAVDEIRQRTIRVIAHEAAHQVLCERGVHAPGSACPAWLAEGLACCFETERALGDFGPDHDVPARRERLVQAIESDSLMPLAALVSMPARPALGSESGLDWYAQCWSVVAWLYRERPRALADYIADGASTGADAGARERLERFERIIGPVTELEAAWRRAWPRSADDRPRATRATRPAARTAT